MLQIIEIKRETGHTDYFGTDGVNACVMRKCPSGIRSNEAWLGSVADLTRELLPYSWGGSRRSPRNP